MLYRKAAAAPPPSMDCDIAVANRVSKFSAAISSGTKRPPPPTPAARETPAMQKLMTNTQQSMSGLSHSGSTAHLPSDSTQTACQPHALAASLLQVSDWRIIAAGTP